ncbi:MAG: choice-of-anchor J domain-containing protein [Paludibacteraceae bacterium]|nr:choice-of-anchor J domain-containing protein [Paludibacteraceae bacterium]
MKKVLFFLASALILASCENFYIDQNLGGSDYNPTDVRTIDYTLTDADYASIVGNKDNVALALAECPVDTLTGAIADSSAYFAFLRIGENLAFNKLAPADLYVPAFLAAKFPQLSKGSLFNITYKNCEGAPEYLTTFASTTKYTLSTADYETIWGEGKGGIYYLTPATMMGLTSVLPAEAEEGAILAVVYEYKDTEPSFGGGNEDDAPKGFFDGTAESRGFYTTSEAIAAVDAGMIAKDDSIKVGGIISRWFKKSSKFDTYHSVSFFVMDPVTGKEHEFEFYNCYTLNKDSFETFEYTDEMNAICIDMQGREFHLGDTVVGAGKYTIYNGTHELNTNCYLTEWRPVATPAPAPKKAAAAANGKKTVLYQYSNGKWVAYKNEAATVVALPEDVYSAVGYTYLLDKNKNVLTTFLAQEYPYAQAGQAYTVVYVSTKEGAYKAIEFIYDGATFVENLGISYTTTTFSLSDVWGSTIYYKQAIMGEGQGKLTIQNVKLTDPLTYVWYYSAAYGMCASAFKDNASYESEAWLVTPQIDLSRAKTPQFGFDHAFNKAPNFTEECTVLVSTNYAGDVTTCDWTPLEWNLNEDGTLNIPSGTSWTFQHTGYFDFTPFVGEKIHIAFRYTTANGVSGTWELKNLLLSEPEN